MRHLFPLPGRFGGPRDGKFLFTFALSLLPLTATLGCAADYARVLHITAKLQAAADNASLGSIAKRSPGFKAAGSMMEDGVISVGIADATCLFQRQMTGVRGYQLDSLTPLVAKAGSSLTSTVSFTAHVPSRFLGLLGMRMVTVQGVASSNGRLPQIDASAIQA
jgi:hypothetical protein